MLDEPFDDDTDLSDFDRLPGEPVSPAEIDRVLASLAMIIDSTDNRTIKEILEDACCELAELADLNCDDIDEAA